MSTTLQSLDERVEKLERDFQQLKARLMVQPLEDTPAGRGRMYLQHSKENRAALLKAAEQVTKEMGIGVPAMSVEELQRRSLEEGVRPEDNLFSRGIIEMREE